MATDTATRVSLIVDAYIAGLRREAGWVGGQVGASASPEDQAAATPVNTPPDPRLRPGLTRR